MPCRVSPLLLVAFTGLLILLHCPTASAQGADFTSKVVRVIDGDTIEVVHNGVPVRILLRGVDCPEKGQPYGNTAKQFTSEKTVGKLVTVKVKEIDKYGRRAADVILPDGAVLNRELLKAGLAWWYRQFSKDKNLEVLEKEARAAKRGLWADPNPVPPWCWRKPQKGRDC